MTSDGSANPAFRDYVTSGAFKLNLSRQQIASLAMIAETGQTSCGGHTFSSLIRKGLIADIRAECGALEYRLTLPGATALAMARMAGLTQGQFSVLEIENTALRSQLNASRETAQQLAADLWDLKARLSLADQRLSEAQAFLEGRPAPRKPLVTLKDKHPERTVSEMLDHLRSAQVSLSETHP